MHMLCLPSNNIIDLVTARPAQKSWQYREEAAASGYIRVLAFSSNAPQEVAEAVQVLTRAGAAAIILDLRDNPGTSPIMVTACTFAMAWLIDQCYCRWGRGGRR